MESSFKSYTMESSFKSNSESVSEIEGFSTDEERYGELDLDSDSDSTLCMSR